MEDNFSINSGYIEHAVRKKADGSLLVKKSLLISVWIALPIVLTLFGIVLFKGAPTSLLIAPFWIALSVALGVYTYRFVSIEYEYTIASGYIIVDVIYGSKSRKTMVEVAIKDMEELAPYTPDSQRLIDAKDIEKVYDAVSEMSAPDVYYGIFTNSKGQKSVLFFEAPDKALAVLRPLNRNMIMRKRSTAK